MKEIVFDFGGTFTDIVEIENGDLISKRFFEREKFGPKNIEDFIKGKKISKIITVGGNPNEVPEKIGDKKIIKANEISSIGAGGLYLSGKKKALVVSLGTGVCFVKSENENFEHIGGTAVGGGTISGLGELILKESSIENLEKLAQDGDDTKLNLTVNDIVGGGIGILPGWVPASYFAKIKDKKNCSKQDLAKGVFSICAGVIASSAIFATKSIALNEIVFGGRLANSEIFFEEIEKIAGIFKIKVFRVKDPEIMTCIGASITT